MQITAPQRYSFPMGFTAMLGFCLLLLLTANITLAATNPATSVSDAKTTEGDPKTKRDNTGQSTQDETASSSIKNSLADIEFIQQTIEKLHKRVDGNKEKSSLNYENMQQIHNGLDLIEQKLKKAYTGLDQSQTNVSANSQALSKLTEDLLTATRDIKANTSDLDLQKSLIEDNSIRLYEILIKISRISETVEQMAEKLEAINSSDKNNELKVSVNKSLDNLLLLLAVILVFLVPLAYTLSYNSANNKPLIDGVQQHQGIILVLIGTFLGYFIVGFGLMYGESSAGFIGISHYLFTPPSNEPSSDNTFSEFLLYQSGLIMLSAMIIYTIIGQLFSSTKHLLLSILVGAIVLPIFAHWTWSGNFVSNNKGWLEGAGFIDQMGSLTINAVAAWFAFIIVWKLGKSTQSADNKTNHSTYSTSSALLLLLIWFGFILGSQSMSDTDISAMMLIISLASVSGGLTAFLHYRVFHSDNDPIAPAVGGFISGLVAIAACIQIVTFMEALVIGAIAGLLQNSAYGFLRKTFLRQHGQARAAHLIAIHGFAGIWGTFCVALFGMEGSFSSVNSIQLITQVQGVAAALAYSLVMGNIVSIILGFRMKKSQGK